MVITPERVREIFKGLENVDGATFFKQVADDVDWTVMGTTLSPESQGNSWLLRRECFTH